MVSTQTDLNPNKSNLLFYKKAVVGFLTLLFFIFYMIRKKFIGRVESGHKKQLCYLIFFMDTGKVSVLT